jgi:hypothetical protein
MRKRWSPGVTQTVTSPIQRKGPAAPVSHAAGERSIGEAYAERVTDDDSEPARTVPPSEQVPSIPSDCGEWHAEPGSYVGDAKLKIPAWPTLDLNAPGAL